MKCRGLVFDTPGRCPACFMDLVAAKNGSAKKKNEASRQAKSIYGIEVEEEGPMMPGMSLTVFAIGVVSVSVIVIATLLQRTISTWERTSNQRHRRKYPRFDLLSVKPLKRLVQWKGFPFAIQSPVVFLFVLVIVADLIREVDNGKNITLILTWNIWWMGLVFFSFLGGTIWCSVCPWMAIPDWLFRLAAKLMRRAEKKLTLSLELPWPRAAAQFMASDYWIHRYYLVRDRVWGGATTDFDGCDGRVLGCSRRCHHSHL